MNRLIVAYGLPGSGKTYHSKRVKERYDTTYSNTLIVNMDDYLVDGVYPSVEEMVNTSLNSLGKRKTIHDIPVVYLDGIISTNKTLEDVIKRVIDMEKNYHYKPYYIDIVCWEENRDACKKNAEQRNDGRNVNVSIDNMKYETINESKIQKEIEKIYGGKRDFRLTIEKRKVYMADTNWEKYFQPLLDESYNRKENVIYSESWSLGGSWGDCWGHSGSISPEPQPNTFKEFDEFLMKVCPNIAFLQYKVLYEHCVRTDEYSESDYYGGTEYYARFALDVKACYEWLLEHNIIEM